MTNTEMGFNLKLGFKKIVFTQKLVLANLPSQEFFVSKQIVERISIIV